MGEIMIRTFGKWLGGVLGAVTGGAIALAGVIGLSVWGLNSLKDDATDLYRNTTAEDVGAGAARLQQDISDKSQRLWEGYSQERQKINNDNSLSNDFGSNSIRNDTTKIRIVDGKPCDELDKLAEVPGCN